MNRIYIFLGSLIVLLMLAVALPVLADSLNSPSDSKILPDQAKLGPLPIPFCATAGDCAAETDMYVSKSVNGTVVPGQEIEYAIYFTNQSNAAARNVVITDTLPVSVTYVSDYNTEGFVTASTSGGQVVWTRPAVNPGESGNLYLRVRVADTVQAGDVLTNVVRVSTSDVDVAPGNDVYTDTFTTVESPTRDMYVYKSGNFSEAPYGEDIQYTINFNNYGNSTAADVILTDTLPANTALVSWSGNAYNPNSIDLDETITPAVSGTQVVWHLGAVVAGGSGSIYPTLHVSDTAQAGDVLTNVVRVSTSDVESPDTFTNVSTDTSNVVTPTWDLQVSKSLYDGDPLPGDEIEYQIAVRNYGNATARDIVVTDTLPTNVTYVSDRNYSGFASVAAGNTVVFTRSTSSGGSYSSLYVTVRITDTAQAGDVLTNVVRVSTSNVESPDTFTNVATDTTQVASPARDMHVEKYLNSSAGAPGGEMGYGIYFENEGNTTASNVVITDTLPVNTSFVSWIGSINNPYEYNWDNTVTTTVSGDQVVWQLGAVEPGQYGYIYPTVYISDTVQVGSTLTNVVRASTSDVDVDPSDDVSTHTVTAASPTRDVGVSKSPSGTPLAGNEFNYRISFQNYGNLPVQDVVVTDTFPANATYVSWSSSPSQQSHKVLGQTITETVNGKQVVWNLGTVKGWKSGYIYLTVRVTDTAQVRDVLCNRVDISTSDVETSATYANIYTSTDTVQWTMPDMTTYKTLYGDAAPPDGEMRYKIYFKNEGNATAQNVIVTDTLPANATYVSWADSWYGQGHVILGQTISEQVIGNQVVWRVGSVEAGQYDYIYLKVRVAGTAQGGDVVTNTLSVSTSGDDWDQTDNTDVLTTTVVPPTRDVEISKYLKGKEGAPGGEITYQIWVGNDGNSTAHDIVITDTLATGVTFVSDNAGAGFTTVMTTGGQVIWTRSVISSNYSYGFDLRVRIPDTAQIGDVLTNVIRVSTGDVDIDTTNNVYTYSTTVVTPTTDMYVTKYVKCGSGAPGGEVEYQIYVGNDGNVTALDIAITDTLPVSATYVTDYQSPSHSTSFTTTMTGNTVVWTRPTMAAGEYGYLYLRVRVTDTAQVGDKLTNVIRVSTSSEDDEPGNDVYTESTTLVSPTLGINVYKYVKGDVGAPGGAITYSISFGNEGNRMASNVIVTDTLPMSTTYGTWYGYLYNPMYTDLDQMVTATVNGNQVVWNVGSMRACTYGYIYLTANIASAAQGGDMLTNVVEAWGSGVGVKSGYDVYTETATVSTLPCKELTGVEITGPTAGYVGTYYDFAANITPPDATGPIIYTWSASPAGTLILPGQPSATYAWGMTGTKTVNVTAQNCGGVTVGDSHAITITAVTPVSITVAPTVSGTLVYTDPQGLTTTVEIPAGAVSETTVIVFTPVPSPTTSITPGLRFAGHAFDLEAYQGGQLLSDFTFTGTVTVTIRYSDDDVAGIDEDTLLLYRLVGGVWQPIGTRPGEGQRVEPENNRLIVWLRGLTRMGVMGAKVGQIEIFLPLVLRNYQALFDKEM